jgi:hypothetical protein
MRLEDDLDQTEIKKQLRVTALNEPVHGLTSALISEI